MDRSGIHPRRPGWGKFCFFCSVPCISARNTVGSRSGVRPTSFLCQYGFSPFEHRGTSAHPSVLQADGSHRLCGCGNPLFSSFFCPLLASALSPVSSLGSYRTIRLFGILPQRAALRKRKKTTPDGVVFFWRRHPESNWGIKVLQTSALPLGYGAVYFLKKRTLK